MARRPRDRLGRVGVHKAGAVSDQTIPVLRDEMNRLRGKLFMVVEAAGLPVTQEDAVKKLIRQVSYEVQANVESSLRGT